MQGLAALPVAIPLLAAAVLMGVGRIVPIRWIELLTLAVAATVAVLCAVLAHASASAPIVLWFGGWGPVDGFARGIAFTVDPLGAGFAALIAGMVAATVVFGWGYFERTAPLYQALLLVFLAAMAGFCLTGDLFNMFVLFELMSVAAFALTGYRLEASALEGALNFTVTNTLGGILVLLGIAVLYGHAGALNLAQLGRAIGGEPATPAVRLAFVLLLAGFLVKAAAAPFHFWLADAHAVAPTPVCVLFSGVMVGVGLFGAARVYWTVFHGVVPEAVVRDVLFTLGLASAVLGALLAVAQRHLKRMLAFSTVSHVGILLVGIALLTPEAMAGAALYLLGHGLVKGALFMGVGILLALRFNVDELALRGRGRSLPVTGAMFIAAALLLAGLPFGAAHSGKVLIEEAAKMAGLGWAVPVLVLASAVTGAAILRAAGRVFLNLGAEPGAEAEAPTEAESEQRGRPDWRLLAPALALLAVAVAVDHVPGLHAGTLAAAAGFTDTAAYAAAVLDGERPALAVPPTPRPSGWLAGLASVTVAAGLGAFMLLRSRLPRSLVRAGDRLAMRPIRALQSLHSGKVADYVVWLMCGVTAIGAAVALA